MLVEHYPFQAANVLQLFAFIFADLKSYQPKHLQSSSFLPAATPSGFEDQQDANTDFPKSLYLIQPLLDSYELNPVASSAQASVPIPEGLDLDAWIVPPPLVKSPITDDATTEKKKKKKSSKGKETATNGKKRKKKTKEVEEYEVETLAPIETEETPEEKALREQVGYFIAEYDLLFT